jgi:hypothetical protein
VQAVKNSPRDPIPFWTINGNNAKVPTEKNMFPLQQAFSNGILTCEIYFISDAKHGKLQPVLLGTKKTLHRQCFAQKLFKNQLERFNRRRV